MSVHPRAEHLPTTAATGGRGSSSHDAADDDEEEKAEEEEEEQDDADEWVPPGRLCDMLAAADGNRFTGLNSPTAGPRTPGPLPRGEAPFQLYSLGTPNGQKVGIVLEELGVDYDAHTISLGGQQFSQGFYDVNPNSKIPAAVDNCGRTGLPEVRLFESGSISVYLAEKHGRFLPADPVRRAECLSWVFWQVGGQGPMTGNFGHFMVYAPPHAKAARAYGVARYGMEVQRLCSVLDLHLQRPENQFICGDFYSIADMMILPWFQQLRHPKGYKHPRGAAARDFLEIGQYKAACRWADRLLQRPQVQRGLLVTRSDGKPWLTQERFAHLRTPAEAEGLSAAGTGGRHSKL